MSFLSAVPFDKVPEDMRTMMHHYDEELGGSGFVRVFAHAPEVFRSFLEFYFPLELKVRGSVNVKITELARLMVAQKNNCHL